MIFMTTIGARLRQARTEKHMTLEEVAKVVKVSRQTIQRYESGIIGNIPSDKIELLAIALGVTPAYIMGWKPTPSAEHSELKLTAAKLASKILASKDEKKIEYTLLLLEKISNMDHDQLEALSVLLRTIK